MLTFESYSPIRVRDKKESAIWITLLVVMSVLLCISLVLASLFAPGGLFGPPEGGAWWAYGETAQFGGYALGAGFLRFVSDAVWEMELVPQSMFASNGANTSNKWCTGDYYFEESESGVRVLHIKINSSLYDFEDPSKYIDPRNVRLVDSQGEHIDNDEWVEYLPDSDGIYTIEIVLIDAQAAQFLAEAARKLTFRFEPPADDDGQGYDLDAENEYYYSIYGENAFSDVRVAQTKKR